jgi:hypothetical protein
MKKGGGGRKLHSYFLPNLQPSKLRLMTSKSTNGAFFCLSFKSPHKLIPEERVFPPWDTLRLYDCSANRKVSVGQGRIIAHLVCRNRF